MEAMSREDLEHFAHGASYGDRTAWAEHKKVTLLWYKATYRGTRDFIIDWKRVQNSQDRHAERQMIAQIKDRVGEKRDGRLDLQVYSSRSPCSDPGNRRAMCAKKLVKFYEYLQQRNIVLKADLKFSSFYKIDSVDKPDSEHWEGLKELAKCDGFTLSVFKGNADWKQFFDDVRTPNLKIVKKRERRNREKNDVLILNKLKQEIERDTKMKRSCKQIKTKTTDKESENEDSNDDSEECKENEFKKGFKRKHSDEDSDDC